MVHNLRAADTTSHLQSADDRAALSQSIALNHDVSLLDRIDSRMRSTQVWTAWRTYTDTSIGRKKYDLVAMKVRFVVQMTLLSRCHPGLTVTELSASAHCICMKQHLI